MERNVRKKIREMIQMLNDEALFHQRVIPGDQDEFEDRAFLDPEQTRHSLYICINELIAAYDAMNERGAIENVSSEVEELKDTVAKLINKLK
jgi:hypothetical protein